MPQVKDKVSFPRNNSGYLNILVVLVPPQILVAEGFTLISATQFLKNVRDTDDF